jgi:zinc D-Ala-D-Ala dipeptidase
MARRMAGEGRGLTRRQAASGLAVLPFAAMPLASCSPPPPPPPVTRGRRPVVTGRATLAELVMLDRDIRLDIRYATTNNFTGRVLYDQPRAFLVTAAAQALVRAQAAAKADGYGLLIHDAYRPWSVTKKLWDATPPGQREFVANPKQGSRHNRGCAVDLTLYERQSGQAVEMPSGYDEFSERSYRNYNGASLLARQNRERLERYMQAEGFTGISNEWWHFDFRDWAQYPVLDISFAQL